jgi:hypothetical protein
MFGNSKRAIPVNIQIIKTFTRLRQLVAANKEILGKVEKMEKNYDTQFRVVFDALRHGDLTRSANPLIIQ